MTSVSPGSPTSPEIRQARAVDLYPVYRIEQAVFPHPWPYRAFEQFLGDPGFLVADAGSIVGYVVAETTRGPAGPVCHVKDLAVREGWRRRGIASALLDRVLAQFAGRVRAFKLEVRAGNEAARRLYRHHGFGYHRTVPAYYDDGEDALVLVRHASAGATG